MHKPIPSRYLLQAAMVCLIVATAGCLTLNGPRPHTQANGQFVHQILNELAQSEAAVQNFRARGWVMVEAPGVERRRFVARMAYVRPERLHIEGYHQLGKRLFEMVCSGAQWKVELPTEDKVYYYDGPAQATASGKDVTPLALARELFFVEEWQDLNPSQVQVISRSQDDSRIVLRIDHQGTSRLVTLEGTPWAVKDSELYDDTGVVLARVERSHFTTDGGGAFPMEVTAHFPVDDTTLRFRLSDATFNTDDLEDTLFSVEKDPNQP